MSGAGELQRLPCLEYFNVLKWENRVTLGLNPAKITMILKMLQTKIDIIGIFWQH